MTLTANGRTARSCYGPRRAITKVSRLRVRRDGRPVMMKVQRRRGGTTEIGGGGGDGGGDGGGGRGDRAIGRNLERATEVAEMETTASVGERRQLARVYTTALCSRRPHRAVSSRARRTFLFVRTPRSLFVSLFLSFSSSVFPSLTSALFWQRQLLPLSPYTHTHMYRAFFLSSRVLFTFFRLYVSDRSWSSVQFDSR